MSDDTRNIYERIEAARPNFKPVVRERRRARWAPATTTTPTWTWCATRSRLLCWPRAWASSPT